MSNAGSVGPYRIGERVGASVWKAEDTRNGKTVALKILTKQLPKDNAKREAFLREVRVAAALYHAFLVPIIEVAPVGDNLLLVMEFLDAQSFSRVVKGKPLPRDDFFRLAYQLADAVRFLHAKNLTHANINTDSVLITSSGQMRLAGLNLTNLVPRPEGIAPAFHQKGGDARSVAYMAPEQITGQQPTDTRSDVYALGVVMYEMSTGMLPFQGATAADLARAIVEGQPASPKTANPSIDPAILNILGRYLFKDSFRRPKDAKAIVDDIAKVDSQAVRAAMEASVRKAPSAAEETVVDTRQSILFIADVANYEQLAAADTATAARAAARMQQVLGEAVYLFDGHVIDPFGKTMVAELPSVENALEAARKGEFDFTHDSNKDPLPVRMLLHAGAVHTKDGTVAGDAVARAVGVLQQLPPLQLHLTEDFVRRGRGNARMRDAGAKAGVKLYTILPVEGAPIQLSTSEFKRIADAEAADAAVVEEVGVAEEVAVPEQLPRRRKTMMLAGLAAIVIIVAVLGTLLALRRPSPQPVAAAAAVPVQTKAAAVPAVAVAPFTIEGPDDDGSLATRGNVMRLAALEILRLTRGVRVAGDSDPVTSTFGAVLRNGAAGPELVLPDPQQPPVPLPDAATGVRLVVDAVLRGAGINAPASQVPTEALNAFAEAVAAKAAGDIAKTDTAITAAVTADPSFRVAQIFAMQHFAEQGKAVEAAAAAKQVLALEQGNPEYTRTAARLLLAGGDVAAAFAAYGSILEEKPDDLEALTLVARYSASAGDSDRFSRALTNLRNASPSVVSVHAPDIFVATGKMATALDKYYDIEVRVPNNPALSVKIGRISVLRRSMPIAEIELNKLQRDDPKYGYHLLKAYMHASNNQRLEAEAELDLAAAASTPGDDFWTSAAEVYAMLGVTTEVLDALTKAAARKEPTASYILNNPLFNYLRSDPQFQQLQQTLVAQQAEIRAALAAM